MSIKIERVTDNPGHKVVLDLMPPKTVETIELQTADLEKLSEEAQKHFARLATEFIAGINRSEFLGKPVTMKRYEPKIGTGTLSGNLYICRHDRSDLDLCFSAPIPLTIELVLQWIEHFSVRCNLAMTEATAWWDEMNQKQKSILQSTNGDNCYYALKALGGDGHGYVNGPHGLTWSLSSIARARMTEIENARSIAVQEKAQIEKTASKAARAAFVQKMVNLLGNDGHKARLSANFLPMEEVADLVHIHVMGSMYEYMCDDITFNSTKPEGVKLTQAQFERYVEFQKQVETVDKTVLCIDMRPVIAYNDETNYLVCEVDVEDPASDWTSTEWYYLD